MNEEAQEVKTGVAPWIPLIQTAVKWIAIIVVVLLFKDWIQAVTDRISTGSSVKIGASGFELGEAPKMEEEIDPEVEDLIHEIESVPEDDIPDLLGGTGRFGRLGSGGGGGDNIFQGPVKGVPYKERDLDLASKLKEMFYLIHAAQKDGKVYDIRIQLGTHHPKAIDRVEKVVYHLHESFDDNEREVFDKSNKFELDLQAWGQFEVKADVYLKGDEEPIHLKRYLNF